MSSLIDYQRALAQAVRGQHPAGQHAAPDGLSMRGLALTRRIRESWCVGRSRRAARLTLSALPQPDRDRILQSWVAQGGGNSSFFEAEAEALLDFIGAQVDGFPHASSLCRFERAIIRARAAGRDSWKTITPDGGALLRRSPDADLVTMHAPVEALLEAVDGARPWPDIGGATHHLLVAPGVAGWVREACAGEVALWRKAETGVTSNKDWATAQSLLACGALRLATSEQI